MITKEEYSELKELYNHGYRWIARDSCEIIYAYKLEPIKLGFSWKHSNNNIITTCGDDFLLPYIYVKWEDEKPTSIVDLINEYEAHQELVCDSKKVIIPQFVADWIEQHKKNNDTLIDALIENYNKQNDNNQLTRWINNNNNICDFFFAWKYGYKVEKEKLYTVRLANGDCLYKFKNIEVGWTNGYSNYKNDKDFQLTQSEIESIDPVLMKIAKEVE